MVVACACMVCCVVYCGYSCAFGFVLSVLSGFYVAVLCELWFGCCLLL